MPGSVNSLHGIVPPVCTPMDEDYSVDTASLARLLEFLLEGGVHGLFVLGSSSEALFLTDNQRDTVMDTAVKTVAGRVPVLAGVFDVTTSLAVAHARAAQRAGVDGLVLTAPFYATFSQDEIVAHFRAVRQAADLPILAYDIPSTVHVKLQRDTVARMAHDGLIVGIKDSSGDDANFRGVVLATRDLPDFATFTGSELVVDAALLFGASGSVPGLGNVDPAGYVRIYDAARAGDWEEARREQERLYQLFSIVDAGTPGRVGPTASALGAFKTALMLRGVISTNVVGRPMIRLNDVEVERVRRALDAAGLLARA